MALTCSSIFFVVAFAFLTAFVSLESVMAGILTFEFDFNAANSEFSFFNPSTALFTFPDKEVRELIRLFNPCEALCAFALIVSSSVSRFAI